MSCYFRHLKQIFEQAGVEVTKDNRQILDQAIHRFLGVEYKDCSPTWKAFKERIRDDEDARRRLIEEVARVAKAAKAN